MGTAAILDPGVIPFFIIAVFAVVIGVGNICFPDYALKFHKQIWGDIGEGFAEMVYKPRIVRIIGFVEVACGLFLAVQAIRVGGY